MLTWNRRDSTPLSAAPRRAIKDGFFGLINPIICSPYMVFHSRVRSEFVIVFSWNPFEMRLLNLSINFYFLRTFCRHLGSFFFFFVPSFTTFRLTFSISSSVRSLIPFTWAAGKKLNFTYTL